MIHPQHHLDIRRRVHLKHKPFPSNKKLVRWLDNWISFLGVITSLSVAPQLLEIWLSQDATSVSLLTWSIFALWTVSMLLYGIVHRANSIIVTYSVGTPLYIMLIIGIIIY